MAYQYLIVAMGQYENGIRIDVKDIQNPGPFLPLAEAFTQIKRIVDEGNTELGNGGTGNFPLRLTTGFTGNGFGTIAALRQMNRAIAARLAVYRQDWQGALDAVNTSFYSVTGSLDAGPAHTYGAPPDAFNPLFFVRNANVNTLMVVHPSVLRDTLTEMHAYVQSFFVVTRQYRLLPMVHHWQGNTKTTVLHLIPAKLSFSAMKNWYLSLRKLTHNLIERPKQWQPSTESERLLELGITREQPRKRPLSMKFCSNAATHFGESLGDIVG